MQHPFHSGWPGGGYTAVGWGGVRCFTAEIIKKALKNKKYKIFSKFQKDY
jgi:hypothetical protein